AKDQKTSAQTFDVQGLSKAQLGERIDAALVMLPQVQMLDWPLPTLAVARQRVADGSAGFADRIVMMVYHARLQQWNDVLSQLTAAEKSAVGKPGVGKPGVRWLRTLLLVTMRRNEEARQRLLEESRTLAA